MDGVLKGSVCITANAHRVFVTEDSPLSGSPTSSFTSTSSNNLCGIVSVVDGRRALISIFTQPVSQPPSAVLSLFARIASVPNIDPQRMQRHRRASSTSSSDSSRSQRTSNDLARSRSNSRTGLQRRVGSVGSFEGFPVSQWAERVPVPTQE